MLGSHFDLSKEIAAIAARREKTLAGEDAPNERAYDDFDHRIREFVRMVTSEGEKSRTAIRLAPDLD